MTTTRTTYFLKASFVTQGDLLVTAANSSGGVPEIDREVREVFNRRGLTEIRFKDGTTHTYPAQGQVEVVGR